MAYDTDAYVCTQKKPPSMLGGFLQIHETQNDFFT